MSLDNTQTPRRRKGAPIQPELAAELRELLADRTPRRLAHDLGVSDRALERAAAGACVVKGTALLIEMGLTRLREAGSSPVAEHAALALVPPPAGEALLTPDDCARRLAVSRSLIYTLIKRGELQAIYVGRLPRVSEAAFQAYLIAAAARGA